MGYRLRNKELQKKLDEISAGSFPFSEALDEECQEYFSSQIRHSLILVAFGQTPLNTHAFSASFHPNEVEKFKEYDPNEWNDYPTVTPPENVLMRIDAGDAGKFCGYYGVFGDGPCWVHQNGVIFPEATSKAVKRFRPWEE